MMQSKNSNKYLTVHRYLTKYAYTFFVLILFQSEGVAQVPDVPKPHDNEPIAFDSLPEVILYIVLPAVLILLYIALQFRRRKKKKNEKRMEGDQEN